MASPPKPEDIDDDNSAPRCWHMYRVVPRGRWPDAMTVVQDRGAPSGFRIAAADRTVADEAFVMRFTQAMQRPAIRSDSEATDDGIIERVEALAPEHLEHFEHRIGQLDFAHWGPPPPTGTGEP